MEFKSVPIPAGSEGFPKRSALYHGFGVGPARFQEAHAELLDLIGAFEALRIPCVFDPGEHVAVDTARAVRLNFNEVERQFGFGAEAP